MKITFQSHFCEHRRKNDVDKYMNVGTISSHVDTRRLLETPFPGADKCNYIDLPNLIRGKEMKFIRYFLYAKAGLLPKEWGLMEKLHVVHVE